MLLDRSNWPSHRPWAIAVALITLAASVSFLLAGQGSADWPGGSSVVGFTFGILGGLIILFEFALWLRKKVRVWAIGSAQAWLRTHIWLGLLCLPLLILHSGLRLGGLLSTVLMVLLVIVVASGVAGLVLQNLLPRRRCDELPGATIYAQRDFLASRLLTEADRLVSATCGASAVDSHEAASQDGDPFLAVGSGRPIALEIHMPTAIAETEPLAAFYRDHVAPFLQAGSGNDSALANPGDAAALFHDCKGRVPTAAHEIVDALEQFCQERRQWDRQVRLHFWLHSWLWVHFPLSVALVVLMFVHAFVALRYW